MEHPAERSAYRETLLSIMFSLLGGSALLFFMFLICGGMALWILAVVAGLAAFGYFHYVLWGYSFTKEVEGEREELEIQERTEEAADRPGAREWTPEERSWYRRF